MSADAPRLDPCGCCRAGVPHPEIHNRPGLPVLDYRIGTHPTFLRRALARLPSQPVPPGDPDGARPLADLTTRSGDDPAVALLDAWATVADVLTFYQERIANEGYLRTATERRSVLELGRAVGYELNPGVAASSFLAFTVEDAPGAPGVATVPRGTKVQSIPDQGQLPQTFETGAQIIARAEWNALRPRQTRPQVLAITSDDELCLLGIGAAFAPDAPRKPVADVHPLDRSTPVPSTGEVQAAGVRQLYLAGTNTGLQAGELLLLVGKRTTGGVKTLASTIESVEVEPELNRTRVVLEEAGDDPPPFAPPSLEPATVKLGTLHLDRDRVDDVILGQSWRERDLAAFLSIQGWSGRSLVEHVNASSPIKHPQAAPPPAGRANVDEGIFAFRTRAGFFGHNAPQWKTLPANQRFVETVQTRDQSGNVVPDDEDGAYRQPWDPSGWEIWRSYPDDALYSAAAGPADVYLEQSFPGVAGGTWAVFEMPAGARYTPYWVNDTSERSVTGFALSAKATGLTLASQDGTDLSDADPDFPEARASDKPADFKVRATTAHVRSERLELTDLPVEEPVESGARSLQLDRMVLGLQADQPLVLSGERADLPGVSDNEIAVLADVRHDGGYTTLFFRDGLRHPYVRETVALNANVAPTTHGETGIEVLGSGDGARPNQRFTLKKPPLTYVPAPTARGSQSTLEVRVDGVLWQEAQRLYDLDERSKSYVVRTEDDGTTHVVFGDGTRGASLPTGLENVVATYRSGIGLSGMVGTDKLTLLQTRPLGVRGVTNPVPASGADEPESRDSARTNAPLAVLTLDRIVSLRDFEDFARTFAGVGKAQAVMLWKGETRLVHITIAAVAPTVAPDGVRSALATNVVERSSSLYANLVEAIRVASDSAQRFQIDSYQPLFFNVKAKVLVDPAHVPASVLNAVEGTLKATFDFQRRDFGQPVTAAEVVTVIQNVPGVVAVDLDHLYRYRDDEPPPDPDEQITAEVLEAEQVRLRGEDIDLTQLLLVNPVGIKLEEMAP